MKYQTFLSKFNTEQIMFSISEIFVIINNYIFHTSDFGENKNSIFLLNLTYVNGSINGITRSRIIMKFKNDKYNGKIALYKRSYKISTTVKNQKLCCKRKSNLQNIHTEVFYIHTNETLCYSLKISLIQSKRLGLVNYFPSVINNTNSTSTLHKFHNFILFFVAYVASHVVFIINIL